jgi:hypothetical protein
MTKFTDEQLKAWAGLGPWLVKVGRRDGETVLTIEVDNGSGNGFDVAYLFDTYCYPDQIKIDICPNSDLNAQALAMAPTLAARVIELEAENERLRKEMQIVIDDCDADYPPSHGAIKHGLRAALKGGEI